VKQFEVGGGAALDSCFVGALIFLTSFILGIRNLEVASLVSRNAPGHEQVVRVVRFTCPFTAAEQIPRLPAAISEDHSCLVRCGSGWQVIGAVGATAIVEQRYRGSGENSLYQHGKGGDVGMLRLVTRSLPNHKTQRAEK
jgi:hypothetical protein